MSFPRRQDDRRRRVLMTSASVTAANPSPGARARMDELREARRPAAAYGSRVRQALRGRWFSLVPVQRKTLAKLFASLALVVVALIIANDATKRFVAIAERPQFVDVFEIMRHGSVGRYFIGVMYLALAGAAWMVYQLRRFRNDDFSGNYRVWQWIVGVSLVSSIATLVPIVAMLGGTIEWVMGKRIALSGQDWIGLLLMVGGAILAMRSVAEMWRYRGCLALLLSGWICIAIPIAVDWNVLTTQTNLRWTIVTSAPLLAVSFWFAASVSYLRSLYREVRGIVPSTGFLERLRIAALQRQAEREFESKQAPKANRSSATATPRKGVPPKTTAQAETISEETNTETTAESTNNKRRWFGLRGPAKTTAKSDSGTEQTSTQSTIPAAEVASTGESTGKSANDNDNENSNENTPKKERRWWPRRQRTPQPEACTNSAESAASDDLPERDAGDSDPPAKKRRFGLGSMMKRKPAEADESISDGDESTLASSRQNNHRSSRQDDESDDDDDADDDDDSLMSDDDVDWSSMNKAERRKMRKQLKRGGRAA